MGNFVGIQDKTIAQGFEDAYSNLTVFEGPVMTIASTRRIATRYVDETGAVAWRVQTLHLNASGQVIAVASEISTSGAPSWVPSGLVR